MVAAVVQLNSRAELAHNVEAAERQVRAAASAGAELVALPEKWSLLGDGEMLAERAEPLEGEAIAAARDWARELGIELLAGSVAERVPGEERLANTSVMIDRSGEITATYRKIHMFDVRVEGVSYAESSHEAPGSEVVLAPAGELELGLTVCYDLRFPELHRILALRGAEAISLPSAFTVPTGRAHWEVLVRARAIENQLFMLAPNQWGEAPPHYESWGHSLIVDPAGEVLADAGEGVGFAVAELDLDHLREIRADLPSLANRRPEAYGWPEEGGEPDRSRG
ncbi:MAG: carbon-nitrogen hydrolase family protein [Solirubrobacterales bacterium]|jgi:predicted amidohydrolase